MDNQKRIDEAVLVLAEALAEQAADYLRTGESPAWECLQVLSRKFQSTAVTDTYLERIECDWDQIQENDDFLRTQYEESR